MGDGFSRIGARASRVRCGAGLGLEATGGFATISGRGAGFSAGGGGEGMSEGGRTSAMLRAGGGGVGRTAMYTMPEASMAPAMKAATIFPFILIPLKT